MILGFISLRMNAPSENKHASSRKGYRRLTDEERDYVINQYLNKVKIEEIASNLKVNIRRVQDIVRNYKKGICSTFTQERENQLVELYKQGKTTVKALRPYFTNIDGYAIRNKIKMFIRWGILNPADNCTTPEIKSTPEVMNEALDTYNTCVGEILEISESNFDDFCFNSFEFDTANTYNTNV